MKRQPGTGKIRKGLLILAMSMVLGGIAVGTMMPNKWNNRIRAGVEETIEAAVPDILVPENINAMVIGHFVMFALFALLLGALFPGVRLYWIFCATLLAAGGSEFVQLFIDGRSARLDDFLIDAAGAFAGTLLFSHLFPAGATH